MTKAKPKDSLVWLEELVEAAKAWRGSLSDSDLVGSRASRAADAHEGHVVKLADAVDGYRQAIKDEVEAEMNKEESNG